MVGSRVRLASQKPVPAHERVGAGPMFWSWAQFGNGKQPLPRFVPNAMQRQPEVLYSGPDMPESSGSMSKLLCGCVAVFAGLTLVDWIKRS